jgi:hypothetical protein
MIQKFYGHTAREKYRRITRGIPLTVDKRIRVVDENIFLDFINESVTHFLFRMPTQTRMKSCTSKQFSMPSTSISRSIALSIWVMGSSSHGLSRCSLR